jgi:hypothetical protein
VCHLGGAPHRRGDLIECRRGFLQACRLLLGAARQIIRGLGDFAGTAPHAPGVGRDRPHRLLQLVHRRVEIRAQFFIIAGEIFGQAEQQVAAGEPLKPRRHRLHHEFLLPRRLGAFGIMPGALRLGLRRRDLRRFLQPQLLQPRLLEDLHRPRHAADFVAALGPLDGGLQIAMRQPPHHLPQPVHRHRDPGADRKKPAQHHHGKAGDNQSERHPDRGVFSLPHSRFTPAGRGIETVRRRQRGPFDAVERRRTCVQENRLCAGQLGRVTGSGGGKIHGIGAGALQKLLAPGHKFLYNRSACGIVGNRNVHEFGIYRFVVSDGRLQPGAGRCRRTQ